MSLTHHYCVSPTLACTAGGEGARAYLARSSQSERWLDFRVPDPTYPLRPFLCGGGMAEKKGTKPKLVTLALRGVSTLEFRNENSRSPSEEKIERAIWN